MENFTNTQSEFKTQMEVDISKLRAILKDQYELDVPTHCDKFLERCLRQKEVNILKAGKLVKAVHEAISDCRHWDAKLDPTCYDVTAYNLGVYCPLPTRDRLGRRVFVAQTKLWNPDKISFEESVFAVTMMSQIAVINEEDQKHGIVIIINCEGFSLRQACAINHRKVLRMAKWIQGGVTGRVKSVHLINHPRICGLIYQGIKQFISDKMRKRIKFHKSLTELQESLELEPTSLPNFCGGTLEVEEYMDMEFMKALLNSTEYFQDMLNNNFPSK